MSFILLEFYSIQIRKPISYLKVLYYSNFTGFPIITLYEEPETMILFVVFFIYMSFRTILIDKPARLYLDLNNIVVHCEDKYWINLDEINTIIIDDLRCNITLKLLSLLCEKGINVMPVTYLPKICKILNVSADYILGLKENSNKEKK